MIHLLRKQDQQQAVIFGGNFHTNKPVASGAKAAVAPYSNLFYWSHAVATADVAFGLHPHEGFEIMTFVLEGENIHYDTETQTWTPLTTGDFQVIQAGTGLQHAEKIKAGTRSFQIWFDPNFQHSLRKQPAYTDYHTDQLQPVSENGLLTTYYIGGNSPARADTEGLTIRKLTIPAHTRHSIPIDPEANHAFYVLRGSPILADVALTENDMLRVVGESVVTVATETDTDLFLIENPVVVPYKLAWN